MFDAFAVVDVAWFVAGGAVVWYGKDMITKWWKGAEAFAQALKAKAAAIEAKAQAINSAVSK